MRVRISFAFFLPGAVFIISFPCDLFATFWSNFEAKFCQRWFAAGVSRRFHLTQPHPNHPSSKCVHLPSVQVFGNTINASHLIPAPPETFNSVTMLQPRPAFQILKTFPTPLHLPLHPPHTTRYATPFLFLSTKCGNMVFE